MDRNFSRSLSLVLRSEGGWSDDSRDPGGATQKGVTLATYRRYINPNGSKDDLRNITDAQLEKVYREQYWNAISGDQLPDGVDYCVMDFAVNSGGSRAARYLQSTVGDPMDGIIGPHTIAAVYAKPAGVIIDHLCDMRLQFLQSLSTWHAFGIGWSARVASVRKNALLMTAMQQSQQNGAPAVATGPVTAIPNNLPETSGPLAVPQVSITAPSAPPKAPAAPVPAKPLQHATIGVGGLAIGAVIANYWHELMAWFQHLFS